jgi:predicted GNAT family N-acyltransferase
MPKAMPSEITCRRVPVDVILPLRQEVLRPGRPIETARFDGDHDAGARHYAALSGDRPVACLSLMPSQWEGHPAWQLRGMATDAIHQGRGLGRRVWSTALEEAVAEEPGRPFWCNARTSAIGFYEKLGWRVASEPFDMPAVGPHVKMVWDASGRPWTHGLPHVRDDVPGVQHPPKPEVFLPESCSNRVSPGRPEARRPGRRARPPVTAFILAELIFLAAAHRLGGPAWVALGVLVMVGQIAGDFRLRPLVGLLPAGAWMVAHRLTGDRELFFPFAMALAAHLAGQFLPPGRGPAPSPARCRPICGRKAIRSLLAGGLVGAAFLGIRVMQAATLPVLAVEAAVAAGILVLVVAALPMAAERTWGLLAITAAASLVAYAGLAL